MFEKTDDWVVLKFGGTSVSSASNWHNIAGVLRERMAAGLRPAVVHSALSGITDKLESLLGAAIVGGHARVLEDISHVDESGIEPLDALMDGDELEGARPDVEQTLLDIDTAAIELALADAAQLLLDECYINA